MAANYLELNTASFHDFMSQRVASNVDNIYNADTEPPDEEDEYRNNVTDRELQVQLRWEKYLRCLQQGAWGDHTTIQAIADINVLSSHHPMLSVTPSSCSTVCDGPDNAVLLCGS